MYKSICNNNNKKILSELFKTSLTLLILIFHLEKSDWAGADGEDPLPDGHHREGLLWTPVHRPQPRQSLAGPQQTS